MNIEQLADQIIAGFQITPSLARQLYDQPLPILRQEANRLRRHFCKDGFDICTIINGKSGRCSENCKFCAQSSHFPVNVECYNLLDEEEIVAAAKHNDEQGVLRFSIVTSGKRLSDFEVKRMCQSIKAIREQTNISVCISFGLLNEEQYRALKSAGATRVHNNLETSRRYFPHICTTHTFDDKIKAIRAAQRAGLAVCSGGIMGLGENICDRIDMAFTLRDLGIKSIPINMLNPISGTPMADNKRLTNEDMQRIVAVYRFILPSAAIRLAGGRGLLTDKGEACFMSGANAVISGDMLTTDGYTVQSDLQMIERLGFTKRYDDELSRKEEQSG